MPSYFRLQTPPLSPALVMPYGWGVRSWPLVPLTEARATAGAPLTCENWPPKTTRPLGATTMPRTVWLAVGAQAVTAPFVALNAASRVRGWPPAVVKLPPA
jgi:hypothetical protein